MSHDPDKEDCPYTIICKDKGAFHRASEHLCTCPPAVDEVEHIRERNAETMAMLPVLHADWLALQPVYQDRDTLLRIVDQQRADLAAAQQEVSLLRIIDRDRSIMPEVMALIEIIDAMAEGNASAYSVIVRQKSLKAALKEVGE